jgi:hypothetical protein
MDGQVEGKQGGREEGKVDGWMIDAFRIEEGMGRWVERDILSF